MKSESKSLLNRKYVGQVERSHLFFTAPHSKTLQRGGKDYNEEVQVHKRQSYAAFLACDFARGTGKNSFLFWGKSKECNSDLDPNYLLTKDLHKHPFHQALHQWGLKNQQHPILHIDLHGKADRKDSCDIDVGIKSMEKHWKGDNLSTKIKHFFEHHGKIFQGYKFEEKECRFNPNPGSLNGYWGRGIHTMSEQAIMLGIPSFQLEMPLSVRSKLFNDKKLRKRFYDFFNKLYEDVIVPDYKENHRPLHVSQEIGQKFVDNVTRAEEAEIEQELAEIEQEDAKN